MRLPRMVHARQAFPASVSIDIAQTVANGFEKIRGRIKPGQQIAIGVGSRGISNLQKIVSEVVQQVRAAGAQPFIIPAMGSHGAATPEGQTEILAEYGITEQLAPIRASMETEVAGKTGAGLPVYLSREALRADGILVVNRVKPHTDFASDTIGSGVLKMMVIGLGKRDGAANYHRAALHHGFEKMLREFAAVILGSAPILGGVAIVEDAMHQTASVTILPREEMQGGEAKLFAQAKALMPRLPFEEIDVLVIDQIGKNISGSGMDPNIIGREVHGYSTMFEAQRKLRPIIHRIFVRDVTPETLGNAIGIGLADFTTTRLVRATDARKTFINSLTSLTPNAAKMPIHFDTDREAIEAAVTSLAMDDTAQARIVRIADTLSLHHLAVSEALTRTKELQVGRPGGLDFDAAGNLTAL